MSTSYSDRCNRIDDRTRRATALAEMWVNGNREYVLRELSFAPQRVSGKAAARMVAALGMIAGTQPTGALHVAAMQILETLVREQDR